MKPANDWVEAFAMARDGTVYFARERESWYDSIWDAYSAALTRAQYLANRGE